MLIDDLTYNYQANSNKLIGMGEAAPLDAKLGDYKHSTWQTNFHAHNSSFGNDYYYDANGNMIKDKQKGIYAFDGEHVSDGITYNHLNLPYYISVTHDFNNGVGGGSITYIYDAVGNKLEKRVQDGFVNSSFSKNTVTDYLTGAVYENNQLQFFVQEEGRVRPVVTAAGTTSFVFDYFLKDHLGNTRTVLTDQRQIDRYPTATLEGSGNASPVSKEKGYYDITDNYVVDKPTNVSPANLLDYPNDNGTNNPNTFADKDAVSQKMYKLNAATNRTGLGRILKVMAGDKIDILAKSYYHYSGQASNAVFNPQDLISAFLNVAASAGGSLAAQHGATQSALNNIADLTGPLSTYSYNNPVNGGNNVKAGISYIILDDQFRFQAGGFDAVQDNSAGGFKPHFLSDIAIPKNGYIYIYCSNESNIDVFFDNFEVVHTRGPLVEENHYYPFGLQIAGISSKALGFGGSENRYKYTGKELQSKEFSDGSGLEQYDFGARNYDPQIGRFQSIDPKAGKYFDQSTYNYVGNNPISRFDPNGMEWDDKAKKEIDGINKKLDSKIGDIDKQIGKVSKSDQDANGNAIYNADEQTQVDELNGKKDNLTSAKSEIQRMGDDKDHLFSLNAKKGITAGGISADPKNLRNVTITYLKGDFANQLHEMKHGFQVTDNLMTLNADGTASAANLNVDKALEVQAYERQLSYNGSLGFSLSPQAGADPNAVLNNMGLIGTPNQINTPFTATKLAQITMGLIPRIMQAAIGNQKLYPEY